jgi:hypothetical protein
LSRVLQAPAYQPVHVNGEPGASRVRFLAQVSIAPGARWQTMRCFDSREVAQAWLGNLKKGPYGFRIKREVY